MAVGPFQPINKKIIPEKCTYLTHTTRSLFRRVVIFSIFVLLFLIPLSSADGLISNPSFETGDSTYWTGKGLSVVSSTAYDGTYSCQASSGASDGFYQVIDLTNVDSVSVYAKGNPGAPVGARFVVWTTGGSIVSYQTVSNANWQLYTINTTALTGNYRVGAGYYFISGSCYFDNFQYTSASSLPESNGTLYFQCDPYDVDDTLNVRYNECFDYIETGYHWFGLLNPLYYFNEYSILKIDSGVYENSSYIAIDDILYQRLDPEGLCWDEYERALTSDDYGVLRAQLIIRKDYYYGIKGLYLRYIGCDEAPYDTDYAYHYDFIGNASATAPVSTSVNDSIDDVPDISTMSPTNDTLPDSFDEDNDEIPDNADTDDDNNGENDSNDYDLDGLPDPVDPADQNPDNDGSTTDTDTDNDGVSDPIDSDDDGDGDLDITDPDDDGDGVPDELDNNNIGPVPTPYNNSTYTPYLPGNTSNNSTYYGVLDGYYSSVDSVISPIDSGVSGFLNMAVYPLTGLSSAINTVTGSATGIFSGALGAILPAGLFIDAVFSALPEKINAFISYYLLLTIILLILGRSWNA